MEEELMVRQQEEKKAPVTDEQWKKILALADTTKYGSITLIFQDGLLVQIDHNEKIRV